MLPRRIEVRRVQVTHAAPNAQIALCVPPRDDAVRREGDRRVFCSERRLEVPLARLDALEDSRHALSPEGRDASQQRRMRARALGAAAHDV